MNFKRLRRVGKGQKKDDLRSTGRTKNELSGSCGRLDIQRHDQECQRLKRLKQK